MISELIDMYEKGAITADHLAVECLHRVDPDDPAPVLDGLPHEILARMVRFAEDYLHQRDGLVTNYGVVPTADQILAARTWIEHAHADIG